MFAAHVHTHSTFYFLRARLWFRKTCSLLLDLILILLMLDNGMWENTLNYWLRGTFDHDLSIKEILLTNQATTNRASRNLYLSCTIYTHIKQQRLLYHHTLCLLIFYRHRLEHYEQACAVDSSTFKCASRPSNCRTAIIGILGTPLRVSCSCQGSTESHYDCVGWQRLLWSNTCVGKIINCPGGI